MGRTRARASGGLSMQPIQPTRSAPLRLCRGLILAAAALTAAFLLVIFALPLSAQASGPSMLVPNLDVRTAVSGLAQPIGLAFLPDGRWLVLEKGTGQVKVVDDGVVEA